ncbi:MAG: hypothetical protein R3F19_19515 [Verrucomicrobiales bacterium]
MSHFAAVSTIGDIGDGALNVLSIIDASSGESLPAENVTWSTLRRFE